MRHLTLTLTVFALIAGLGGVAAGDRTSWSRGFGWDGRTYGNLAQHFPGAVFGDEGVTPPGYGDFRGRRPEGIDDYYVGRILPSAVVYYTLAALSVEKTSSNVATCFGVWNAVMLAFVALFWCLIADRIQLGSRAKLLGFCALLINFAALKSTPYFPVLTDAFAYGVGAASVYFWLCRRTLPLVAVTLAGAFTWPTQLVVGAILLAFPPGELPLTQRLVAAKDRHRAERIRLLIAAVPAVGLVSYLIYLRASGFQAVFGIPLGGAFAPAVFVVGAFVFAGLFYLVPVLTRHELTAIARSLLSRRMVMVVAMVVFVLLVQSAIAERASIIDEGELLRSSIFYSALNPGLFAIAMVSFFGPLLVVTALRWRPISHQIRSFGPGATVLAALFVLGCLQTEPRKLINLYPLIVLFTVIAVEGIAARRWFMPTFVVASVAISRIWLPIGEFGLSGSGGSTSLLDFPAQRYFMSSGVWMSYDMYLVQLGVAVLLAIVFLYLLRPRGQLFNRRPA